MKKELKKCPFCGGTARMSRMGYPHWVYCESCGAKVQGGTHDEIDSINAWNRREKDIVYCKDCKHWYLDADTAMACDFTKMGQPEDGYCNWGEKNE